jgi:hypothetical protein
MGDGYARYKRINDSGWNGCITIHDNSLKR